jgi:RHS repeat-associated protein
MVTSVTAPYSGAPGDQPQTTLTTYDNMLRATSVVYPDGTSVASQYLPTSQLALRDGSGTYPVAYSYDYAGRMQTMTNWSSFPSGGARVTTWSYDPYRGFLIAKTDASNNAVSYRYTPAGRLASRTWARGTITTNTYNPAGDLWTVSYNDGATPGITNGYDRLGRLNAITNGATVTTRTYDLAGDLSSESYLGGILNGLTVTNQFDSDLRRTNLALLNGSSRLCQAIYGYDNASRLASVSDGTNSAAYSYLANSPLVGQIVFKQSGTTRMTTSKQYDYLNRLSAISSTPSNAFAYQYNAANQRTMNRLWDGSYWRYGYDALGQVISGNKYWVDQTPVAGQQFDYAFDSIGNRTQAQAGGDQNGANLRLANYTNNVLNQITSRGVPGYIDVMGDALATNSVTVNGQTAYRKFEYFRQQLAVTNTSTNVWQMVSNASPGQTSVTGHIYVPKNPETYTYDADGNMLSDGRWTYAWDGENRLVGLTSLTNAASGSKLQLSFAYDYQGRRIQKIVSTNSSGTNYVGQYTNNYAYDGWNCIAILNPSLSLLNSFLWGSELSGSMQGAGGVGGLVAVNLGSNGVHFVEYDGNGNVAGLVSASNATTTATYEYGPFGELIRATGQMAKLNPFRFSTKYDDDETDLLYYGFRYYNPSTGRWPSRDPGQERGGLNLYGFVRNDAIDWLDTTGEAPTQAATSPKPGPPKFVNRKEKSKTCAGGWWTCGYYGIAVIFDLTITDASGVPVPNVLVTEAITYPSSYHYIGASPITGSAITDAKGGFEDNYLAHFSTKDGWLDVKQTVTIGTLNALLYTHLNYCNWSGNTRSVFQ